MTTIWPVSPWRRALREDFCFPASVLGPVDFCAFSWLMAARAAVESSDMIGLLTPDCDGRAGVGPEVGGKMMQGKEIWAAE